MPEPCPRPMRTRFGRAPAFSRKVARVRPGVDAARPVPRVTEGAAALGAGAVAAFFLEPPGFADDFFFEGVSAMETSRRTARRPFCRGASQWSRPFAAT